MSPVKLIIEHMVEKGNDAHRKRNTKTENINKCKNLVFQQVPEGDKKIIFKHNLISFIHT